MRVVLACGDREWSDFESVLLALTKLHKKEKIMYLVEGGCAGADTLARKAAEVLGIQPVECKALWTFYGKRAGPIRNQMQLAVAQRLAGDDELILLDENYHGQLRSGGHGGGTFADDESATVHHADDQGVAE